MEHVNTLKKYGLFDAKVPRYTSYPPANRFEPNIGARLQEEWLAQVPQNEPISIYVHIPFCRRLCWFCACRTQGTQTMKPLESYLDGLIGEIDRVAQRLSGSREMARLHLGGGTPTLLTPGQMRRLLDAVEGCFSRTEDFEFSVEIDPTEANPEVLTLLAQRGMRRASIGVQDFDIRVQNTIGRQQSYTQTKSVVDRLRALGVESLNIDLLYGLPYQTVSSLQMTLIQVCALRPDRLALYGYAHVPHVSKRQIMIPDEALPNTFERFEASVSACQKLEEAGYQPIGIDHFALPSDSLTKAQQAGTLKRNFQGYTDDPCSTLIGFGASAISKFAQGYVQNAVATAAYQDRLEDGKLAGHKGYKMRAEDRVISDLIDQIMCHGRVDIDRLTQMHPCFAEKIYQTVSDLQEAYPQALSLSKGQLVFQPGMDALARVVAAKADTALNANHMHSTAI